MTVIPKLTDMSGIINNIVSFCKCALIAPICSDVTPTIASMSTQASPSFRRQLEERISDVEISKGERTRATIRWATVAVLEEIGYASFTLDTVAKRANVSRPAIYQYYGSQRDCVLDVLSEFLNVVVDFVERDGNARRAKAGDLLTSVVDTNREYIAFYRENATLVERVRELREEIPELIALQQEINKQWAERLAKHIRKNTALSSKQALFTAYALESMIDDFLRELFVLKNPHLAGLNMSDDELAVSLSEFWARAAYGVTPLKSTS